MSADLELTGGAGALSPTGAASRTGGLSVAEREELARTYARRARLVSRAVGGLLGLLTVAALAVIVGLIGYIVYRGAPSISWGFLTSLPQANMTAGGIFPALLGTLWLLAGTALFVIPVGVSAGIYLSEFSGKGRVSRVIRLAISNMAGVPSIVYGLFGLALFVMLMGMGRCVLAGSLTLACLTLPVVITSTEEALQQIPQDLRQASLALGATKMQGIFKVILPAAFPGICTGCILGLSRAAGETAPIMLTAVAFSAPVASSLMDQTMALPYHLYIMAMQATVDAEGVIWGSALVLVAGVCLLNMVVAIWRARQRKKVHW